MNQKEEIYCKMIGKAIRELRQEIKGKSLCMFAYENDIPRSTLSRIEIGDNEAKLVTLKKIAEGFGWSLSELFERIEEKLPNNFKIFDDEHY
jgi:transcriptional regulator with XRE-family HTH domain